MPGCRGPLYKLAFLNICSMPDLKAQFAVCDYPNSVFSYHPINHEQSAVFFFIGPSAFPCACILHGLIRSFVHACLADLLKIWGRVLQTKHAGPMTTFNDLSSRKLNGPFWPRWVFEFGETDCMNKNRDLFEYARLCALRHDLCVSTCALLQYKDVVLPV